MIGSAKIILVRIVIALFLLVLVGAGAAYYLTSNIHVVIPGQVYRSAQLAPWQLRLLVRHAGIRSELNLRGLNLKQPWYQSEIKTAHALGIKHYDVALWKYWQPTRPQFLSLLNILQDAPKPLLLHCASGSDRSGFVSALALLLEGKSLKVARSQISWLYLAATTGTIGPIVLNQYAQWLRANHVNTTAYNLIYWVKHVYRA